MRLWLAALLLLFPIAAEAQGRGPGADQPESHGSGGKPAKQGQGRRHFAANPSALVAAEIALFQLAQKEGLWKALRESAAPGAVIFVPERVTADEWLKGRDEAAAPIKFDPGAVWMSCDGSYGVVEGGWRQEDLTGRFVTVWQRQEKGEYKWILDRRDIVAGQSGEPDMISATVSGCSKNKGAPQSSVLTEGFDDRLAASEDESLYWRESLKSDGSWAFALRSWNGEEYALVLRYADPAAQTVD